MHGLLRSRVNHHIAKLGIFLLAAALVLGVTNCAPIQHTLSVRSTLGGSVAVPGEGDYFYGPGQVVELEAEADEGYRFVNWTGDVDTIADVEAASTTITMNGDYEIVANFGEAHELTVSSTQGGSVTTPGEGVFTYEAGAVVSLVASPASGHRFVTWTGDVDTIVDVEAASTTITMNGDYSITASFGCEGVCFACPNLEAVVRETIDKPEGPIHAEDLAGLTHLSADRRGISYLTGLEHATDLTELRLMNNSITDISPVQRLTNLTRLWLGGNQISDISPVAGLTDLTHLYLHDNGISDISPVRGLTNLTSLDLWDNKIGDISPLEGLTNLTVLYLAWNQVSEIWALAGLTNLRYLRADLNRISDISSLAGLSSLTHLHLLSNQVVDISPLEGLTSLTELGLSSNQIVDIRPLVDNPGLGEGDHVDLAFNPLSDQSINEYIPALQARGVTVSYRN